MILADIGEIGIHKGGAVYKLRPSLYAISKLGAPAEIVRLFADLHVERTDKRGQTEQFALALGVLHACADSDEWAEEIIGTYTPSQQEWGKAWRPGVYRPGAVNAAHVLVMARSLMVHGVIGDVEALPRNADDEQNYSAEFVPRDYVAMAVAHLGMGEVEAWRMTMTSLALALRSKYPPSATQSPGRNAPSSDEHDDAMAWADQLDAMRK